VSHKDEKIEAWVAPFRGRELDPHYLGYFHCFNHEHFFEAHEVLEALWLPQRHGPDGAFYKGLIQLAGAFVHLQKTRPGPAAALFRLAQKNLAPYGARHRQCDLEAVLTLIENWTRKLAAQETLAEGGRLLNPPHLESPAAT
jgi:predicted metal-dependent hydrolase